MHAHDGCTKALSVFSVFVRLSAFLSHTHQSAIIFLWLQPSVPSSSSPQETLLEYGGGEKDVKIYVIFNNITQKSLFEGFLWLL